MLKRPLWLDRRGPCKVCGEIAAIWQADLGPMHVECADPAVFRAHWREAKAAGLI